MCTEEFVRRCRERHGDAYDYSRVAYSAMSHTVSVICPTHGVFNPTAANHLHKGTRCPGCFGTPRQTTEQFIARAREIHGDRYDYQLVNYQGLTAPVTIVCPAHGEWTRAAGNHVTDRSGCPRCRGYGKTTAEFTVEAAAVHGDRYDYSAFVYVNATTAGDILCREHGFFQLSANSHVSGGRGCPTCAGLRAPHIRLKFLTVDAFVNLATAVHGDRYDYSKVTGFDSRTIPIVCGHHGQFEQGVHAHLRGSGCMPCAWASRTLTTEEFVSRARELNGDRYDYSKSVYTQSQQPITITCKRHGDYITTPNEHLSGINCVACYQDTRCLTTEVFVERSRAVHGDRYDYSLSVYTKIQEPIVITCRTHGDFTTWPIRHFLGNGCGRCSTSRGEDQIARLLERAGIKFVHEWKDHGCMDKGPLRFDFMLPELRTLIEFDGRQHFEPSTFGSKTLDPQAALDNIQRRDAIKNVWAAENGWRMVRVRYDENVQERLTQEGIIKASSTTR